MYQLAGLKKLTPLSEGHPLGGGGGTPLQRRDQVEILVDIFIAGCLLVFQWPTVSQPHLTVSD